MHKWSSVFWYSNFPMWKSFLRRCVGAPIFGFRPSIKLPSPIRALPAQYDRGELHVLVLPAAVKIHLGPKVYSSARAMQHQSHSTRSNTHGALRKCNLDLLKLGNRTNTTFAQVLSHQTQCQHYDYGPSFVEGSALLFTRGLQIAARQVCT